MGAGVFGISAMAGPSGCHETRRLRPWRQISGALAGVLVILAVATSASAEAAAPNLVTLRWQTPAECPTRDSVLDDAGSLARRAHGAPRTEPVTIDALVERISAGRWRLTLTVGAAQRRVEAPSCAQLARAVALFVALITDPSGSDDALATAAAGAPVPAPASPSPKEAATGNSDGSAGARSAKNAATPAATFTPNAPATTNAAREARPGPRELVVLAAAAFVMDVGTLPNAEPLGALEVGIRYRRAELTFQWTAGPAQDKTIDGAAGARLRPMSVTLAPCFAVLRASHLRVGPCVRGEVGWIHAQGIGLATVRSADVAWVALGGDLVASWALGANFEARLGAGGLVPLLRPRFELTGLSTVFEPGIAFRAGTAAVVRF